MKYCIFTKFSNSYVKSILFRDCGVEIEFTTNERFAAKTDRKDAAEALAKCIPGGKVRQHSEEKPTMTDYGL